MEAIEMCMLYLEKVNFLEILIDLLNLIKDGVSPQKWKEQG